MLVTRSFSTFISLPYTLFSIVNVSILQVWFFNLYYKVIIPTWDVSYSFLDNASTFKSVAFSRNLSYNLEYLTLRSFRVVFKGKGFRVKIFRNKRKVTFNFGHSHWTKLKVGFFWFFYKLRRQSYVFITFDLENDQEFKKILPNIRIMNRYTQRGLRLKKQSIKKRFGKISQYISSLH